MARRVSDGGPAIPMNIHFRLNSLALRIAIPLLIVCLLGGIGLYAAMQQAVSRFSERQIEQFLSSMAATAYLLCDGNGNGLTSAPPTRDPAELRIRQAHAMGSLENFFRQNELTGFIVAGDRRIALNRVLSPELQAALEQNAGSREVALSSHGNARYASVGMAYPPWGWRVVIAMERTAFQALMQDVRWLYASVALMLVLGFTALVIALEETVQRPIRGIIDSVRQGGRPGATGVAEFDYLADQLQQAIRKRNTMLVNMERTHFLYSHDVHGNFTYVSPSIADILGYRPEEFLTHFSSYLTDHPVNREVARLTALSIQGLQQLPYEVEIHHRDGSRRWLEVTETPAFGDDGTVTAVEGIARDITEARRVREERERLIADLQKAAAEIKTLRGIIPICASCKQVRNDEGAWQQVELYIRAHSNAEFSHGICPECLEKMYPGYSKREDK